MEIYNNDITTEEKSKKSFENLKNLNIDYADVVFELKKKFKLNDEAGFYFYEECQDNYIYINCNSYQDVIDITLKTFEEESKKTNTIWHKILM